MLSIAIIPDVETQGFRAMVGIDGTDDPRLIHLSDDAEIELGALAHGMSSGAPSIAFCFKIPDGKVVIAESSLNLLLTAADTLKSIYGDPRT